jgi:hypothetical protein
MEREVSCNFEDIYYNMDGETEKDTKQHSTELLDDRPNTISFYCNYIYNYIIGIFFTSRKDNIYE